MYLHLGGDVIVRKSDIVCVCDLDNTTGSKITRDFLSLAERAGRVVTATEELPKSFIVCRAGGIETVYLSLFAPATLAKRM